MTQFPLITPTTQQIKTYHLHYRTLDKLTLLKHKQNHLIHKGDDLIFKTDHIYHSDSVPTQMTHPNHN